MAPITRSQKNKQIRKESSLPIGKRVKKNQVFPIARAVPVANEVPVADEVPVAEPCAVPVANEVPVAVTVANEVPVAEPVGPTIVKPLAPALPDKKFLENKNRHPRDEFASTITVPITGPVYGIKPNKKGFVSPSKFIHEFTKPFDADAIIAGIIASGNPKYEGMTEDEIKFNWDLNNKIACAKGNKMHNAIELYYNQVPGIKKATAWEGLEEECSQFDEFIAFQESTGLVPVRTEWRVYDEDTRIAGDIDMLFRNKSGGYELYDWKRVKELKKTGFTPMKHAALCHLGDCNYWHYTLQLNLYKHILESKYGMKIDRMYLVEFYPGKKLKRHECPSLESELNEVFESFK